MIFVFLGAFSFVLMIIYDFNQISKNKKTFLNSFFLLGVFILIVCTLFLLSEFFMINIGILNIIGIVGGLIFLSIMIFALFFNLPVKKTYGKDKTENSVKNQTVTTGLYSLCRHPGVLAFFFCYFFFYIAVQTKAMLYAWLIWSAFDVIYVIIQDKYIFPKTLSGYHEYKESTPFLIPNLKSIRSFLRK